MTVAEPLTDERDAFLRLTPHTIVATIQPDGQPQLTPNWYLWDGERFWISTLADTIKVRNVKRDPRVTLCMDAGTRRANYVQVFGTGEVLEGDVREMTLELIRKYEHEEAAALAHWEGIKDDRVLIVVTPTHMQWRYEE
jgi:PPOX class probable F420-dependent enzyme